MRPCCGAAAPLLIETVRVLAHSNCQRDEQFPWFIVQYAEGVCVLYSMRGSVRIASALRSLVGSTSALAAGNLSLMVKHAIPAPRSDALYQSLPSPAAGLDAQADSLILAAAVTT